MEKKKDELQSRRDFFKKAVKTALPILGMAIVASTPLKLFASQSDPSGCDYGCVFGCSGGCGGGCSVSCQNTCRGTCQGCKGCSGSCSISCTTTCGGGCSRGNYF